MPPLTLTYSPDALRCLTIGGEAMSGSRITPPTTGGKGLKTDEIGARVAGNQKARLCPTYGAQTCLLACIAFPTGNEINSLFQ